MIIPTPRWKEVDEYIPPSNSIDPTEYARIKAFFDVPSWKCTCGLTNHGRNEKCADYRCRKERPR